MESDKDLISTSEGSSCGSEEGEEKISVRTDPCLLCAEVAVTYDLEGNFIKKESFLDHHDYSFPNEALLRCLCRSLGMTKKKIGDILLEKLQDPFPFCEECQSLLNSLGQVYSKLDELENMLKTKMERAEEVYWKENLYGGNHNHYLEFRKEALGTNFKGNSSDRKVARRRKKRIPMIHTENQLSDDDEYLPSPVQLSKVSESDDDDDKMSSRSINVESPRRRVSKRKIPSKSNTSSTCSVLPNSRSSKPLPLGRPKNSRKEIKIVKTPPPKTVIPWHKPNTGHMEKDLITGNCVFHTGYGNKYHSTRTVLHFTKTDNQYKCESCSALLPTESRGRRQQQVFRRHYSERHSTQLTCRLCDGPTLPYPNSEALVQHLGDVHKIRLIYYSATKKGGNCPNFTWDVWAAKLGKIDRLMETCSTCGMPFLGMNPSEQKEHLESHMNEDERKLSSSSLPKKVRTKRRRQVLVASGALNQCQTCGKFVSNKNWKEHQLNHENNLEDPEEPQPSFVCEICGAGYASQNYLERHIEARHPDGKWDGPWKCKFPNCVASGLDSEDGLKAHVLQEHGTTQKEGKRQLCLQCGMVSVNAWTLRMHSLTHSKEKKFRCEFCSRSYALKGTLNQHLAAVHGQGQSLGEFRCPEMGCGQVFPCNTYLKAHMRNKHGLYVRGKMKPKDN